MSTEQVTALIVAVTGLVAAIGALIVQLRLLRKDLNGRVSQLLETSSLAQHRLGELEGRDFMHRLFNPPSAGHDAAASRQEPTDPHCDSDSKRSE